MNAKKRAGDSSASETTLPAGGGEKPETEMAEKICLAKEAKERKKAEMRARDDYKNFENILQELQAGREADGFKTAADFFQALRDSLAAMGRNSLEKKTAELFLADHEVSPAAGLETAKPDAGKRKLAARKEKPVDSLTAAQTEEERKGEYTLAEVRQRIMEWFPRLAVRGTSKEQKISNLDGNSCLFFFRDILGFVRGTEEEKAYVDEKNIVYTSAGTQVEGALNLDTSDHVEGGLADKSPGHEKASGYIDHHGRESQRQSSAFRKLRDYFEEAKFLSELKEEDALALERLSQFVTYVDSYTLPKKGDKGFAESGLSWPEAWHDAHRTLFGVAISYQTDAPVEDLFEFFRRHTMAEAFTLAIDESNESYLEKIKELGKKLYQEAKVSEKKNRQTTDNFFERVNNDWDHKEFVVDSPVLGKIVVFIQDNPDQKVPALQFAALANGYDGTLLWKAKNHTFALSVGSHKKINEELAKTIGQGEWVRESMIVQSHSDKNSLSLRDLLTKLGVEVDKFDPKSRLGKEVNAPATTATPAEALSPSTPAVEIQPPHPEAEKAVFKKGDLVKVKEEVKGDKPVGSKKVVKAELIGQSIYYTLEDFASRAFREELLERVEEKSAAVGSLETGKAEAPPLPAKETSAPAPVETAGPPAEFTPAPSIRRSRETAESLTVEINVGEAERKFNESRQTYIKTYKNYLKAKKNVFTAKSIYKKVLGFFKPKEQMEQLEASVEQQELKEKLEKAREEYLETKKEYAKALYQSKARELAQQGKDPAEIAAELEKFGQREILQKLIIGEEKILQEACAADWPDKEKSLWRRAFEWWAKIPAPIRVAISTAVVMGLVASAGGFSAVGATGVAFFAGWRYARGLGSVLLAKGAGKLVDIVGGRTIEKKTQKSLGGVEQEFAAVMKENPEKVAAVLGSLSGKYHEIFEKRAKMDRTKLLIKIGATVAVGAGAAVGLRMLEGQFFGGEAGEAVKETPADQSLGDLSRKFEEMLAKAKARGQGIIAAMQEKATALSKGLSKGMFESAEPAGTAKLTSPVSELATLKKGEGIIAVLRRQLEVDPKKFGFAGDIRDSQAVHGWAERQATQISIKEGYWNPVKQTQKWFVYDPRKPMKFILEGDNEKGFSVRESGEVKSFIHLEKDEEIGRLLKKPSAGARPLSDSSARILHGVRHSVNEVSTAEDMPAMEIRGSGGGISEIDVKDLKMPALETAPRLIDLGGAGDQKLNAPLDYEWVAAAQSHASLLNEKLLVARELEKIYQNQPNLAQAAKALEDQTQKEITRFVADVKTGRSLEGYDVLKKGKTLSGYHDFIKQKLENKIWKAAGSSENKFTAGEMIQNLSHPEIKLGNDFIVRFAESNGKLNPQIIPQGNSSANLEIKFQDLTYNNILREDNLRNFGNKRNFLPERLVTLDVGRRALEKLVESGAGKGPEAAVLRQALRTQAEAVAKLSNQKLEDVFAKEFLQRIE